jgi:cell wall-associated NlpC family hydrolase
MPEVPAWAAGYVGLPYQMYGRDFDGVDCWGLVNLVWDRELAAPLPIYRGVGWHQQIGAARLSEDAVAYARQFDEVPPGCERLGDGILIAMRGHPIHVGLVVAPGIMLHCLEGADSCIEDYRRPFWAARIVGFYRPRA